MSDSDSLGGIPKALGDFASWGIFWLIAAVLGAALFFQDGLAALLAAWQMPEYSHGPLIPILSGFLFLLTSRMFP